MNKVCSRPDLIPGSRKRAVREWMEKSAEAGNPLAMVDLARMVYDEDKDKSEVWLKKAIDKGFLIAVDELAIAYGQFYGNVKLKYGYKPKEAYSLFYSIQQVIGKDSLDRQNADRLIPKLEKKLTPAEIEEAKKDSVECLKTHQLRDYTIEFGGYL